MGVALVAPARCASGSYRVEASVDVDNLTGRPGEVVRQQRDARLGDGPFAVPQSQISAALTALASTS